MDREDFYTIFNTFHGIKVNREYDDFKTLLGRFNLPTKGIIELDDICIVKRVLVSVVEMVGVDTTYRYGGCYDKELECFNYLVDCVDREEYGVVIDILLYNQLNDYIFKEVSIRCLAELIDSGALCIGSIYEVDIYFLEMCIPNEIEKLMSLNGIYSSLHSSNVEVLDNTTDKAISLYCHITSLIDYIIDNLSGHNYLFELMMENTYISSLAMSYLKSFVISDEGEPNLVNKNNKDALVYMGRIKDLDTIVNIFNKICMNYPDILSVYMNRYVNLLKIKRNSLLNI